MSASTGNLSRLRFARCWAAMLLTWMLVGCAMTSGTQTLLGQCVEEGPRFIPSSRSAAPPRLLLAMNDGSAAGGEPTSPSPRGYNVPGRNPNSEMPWQFFLGNAAHRLIAYMYGVHYPQNRAFYNTKTIDAILEDARLGDKYRLLPNERNLRPDITDVTVLYVFEIKPWNEQGLLEGRQEVQVYLAVLNRAVSPEANFLGGTEFQGEVLIRFARGQYIWRGPMSQGWSSTGGLVASSASSPRSRHMMLGSGWCSPNRR
jgi:hypothetical protein